MKAVIMAGGMGTRLRAISGEKPKPMTKFMGVPIMEHIVLRLKDSGFEDICAALAYRAGDIIAYFGDGSRFGVNMTYRTESEPRGTAGAVKNCRDFYGDEDFLVISGDALCDFELDKLMQMHKSAAAAASLALHRQSSPLRFGLALRDDMGDIRSFIEKPDWPHVVTDLVNTGIYALSPRAMEYVPESGSFDFGRDLFPLLLKRGEKLRGVELEGFWCDLGTPEAYYRCCLDAIEGKVNIRVPEEYAGGKEEKGRDAELEGETAICPCRDRAGLMRLLSEELMELGAEYSEGIWLKGKNCQIRICPSAELSALRLAVRSDDAEFARAMLDRAKTAVEAAAKGMDERDG